MAEHPPALGGTERTQTRALAGPQHGLLRRGFVLEFATLGWNVVGIVVLAVAAVGTRSVALAGFGLDSLIEIGASIVVVWELSGGGEDRQRRALRLIGGAFVALAGYLAVQSTVALAVGHRPGHGRLGIVWTAATAVVMFALAAGKARTGRAPCMECALLGMSGRSSATAARLERPEERLRAPQVVPQSLVCGTVERRLTGTCVIAILERGRGGAVVAQLVSGT